MNFRGIRVSRGIIHPRRIVRKPVEKTKVRKRVGGVIEGSFFHLKATDNAAMKSLVSVMLEEVNPNILFEIGGMLRSLIKHTASNVSTLQTRHVET